MSSTPVEESSGRADRTPRLALWLAKKSELIASEDASYDLVMSGWFEPAEADSIGSRSPSTKLLAGLGLTWIWEDPAWLELLVTVANGGDPTGPLQITDDMYLVLDDDGDGLPDRRCDLPGWEGIHAMDPRHPGWRRLILAFYETAAQQPQHDGVAIDMVDAFPFCEGAYSGGVPTPIDAATWVSAQSELLSLIRAKIPPDKWILANAGRDFPAGSPFPRHVNGYLLENFGGSWGAGLGEGLASAQRAMETTLAPHVVVFAVDTDDTGEIDWARFRVGYAASLLLDNTYFAFDYGSRDHGGVTDWWFPAYYQVRLGDPLGPFTHTEGVYRRAFEKGLVVVADEKDARVSFQVHHLDVATGETGLDFFVPEGDAKVFVRAEEPEPLVRPGDRWGIYALDLAAQQVEQLYSSPAEISALRLNSAGDRFAFSGKVGSSADEQEEIWTVGIDGRDLQRLTDNAFRDLYPAWSPTGSEIAFLSWRDTDLDIYVMTADGGNERRLYDSGSHDADIHWVGDQVAFTSHSRVWMMRDDGTNARPLTDPPRAGEWGQANLPFGDYDPRISPDGTRVVFERMVGDESPHGNYDLYAVGVDGTGMARLTDTGYAQGLASWSHAGDRIVYIVAAIDDVGQYDIYAMNADGTENRNLTPDTLPPRLLCRCAIFSRDDSTIYFVGEWWPDG